MASLTKRRTSAFWVACFTDRDGRRLKRSTKSTNRREAQRIADAFEDSARRKRTALQARRVIAELHRNITGDGIVQCTVRQFFTDWLGRKKTETAATTHAFYKGASEKFLQFLGDSADADISEINREHLHRFRNEQSEQLASKTVNHLVKFLRMVFRAAKRDTLIIDNPAEFLDTIREKQATERRPFTLDELRATLAAADDEWKSMVLFGLYTGQRLSDIATLTWANVDLSNQTIRLIAQKTGRSLLIPIAAPLQRHLEGVPSSDEPNAPLHPKACAIVSAQGKSGHLSNQFADILVRAGLRKKQAHRKTHGTGRGKNSAQYGLSFHCLRHTAVTLLKEAGIPAAVVMEFVGHDSEQMSKHYTHVGHEALQKATQSLPDLLR